MNISERAVNGLADKLADARERLEVRAALLREAREWIGTELKHTECELPDAEDLVRRIDESLAKYPSISE